MRRASLLVLAAALAALAAPAAAAEPLRVCADPNNMPFSDKEERGFENRLAELVAGKLGRTVEYTWWAQRRGFVRNTVKAGLCDVVMGVPAGYELLATTRPYYRSAYVFVTRASDGLRLTSLLDPRLGMLKVGVQLVGDDGTNTPPAHALGAEGHVENVKGYMVTGDYRRASPPSRIVEAVADGEVDVAAVWGPLAGYYAGRAAVPLELTPVTDTERFAPLAFAFDISIGVKRGDEGLRAEIDRVIADNRDEIAAVLADYGVPTLPLSAAALAGPPPDEDDD
jgi:mxaJ protein